MDKMENGTILNKVKNRYNLENAKNNLHFLIFFFKLTLIFLSFIQTSGNIWN